MHAVYTPTGSIQNPGYSLDRELPKARPTRPLTKGDIEIIKQFLKGEFKTECWTWVDDITEISTYTLGKINKGLYVK